MPLAFFKTFSKAFRGYGIFKIVLEAPGNLKHLWEDLRHL